MADAKAKYLLYRSHAGRISGSSCWIKESSLYGNFQQWYRQEKYPVGSKVACRGTETGADSRTRSCIRRRKSKDDEDFENEVKITAIKEYTIANIYKNAYNDSFISKVITSIENSSSSDETVNAPTENVTKPETNTPVVDNNNDNDNNTTTDDDSDDTYPEYLELTEAVKSQIYDAGVNAAIEFIGQNIQTSSSAYCREVYDALENDNPLGENKEEGYKSFLEGFKTTLENNGVDFE